jgi:hypothetical protein
MSLIWKLNFPENYSTLCPLGRFNYARPKLKKGCFNYDYRTLCRLWESPLGAGKLKFFQGFFLSQTIPYFDYFNYGPEKLSLGQVPKGPLAQSAVVFSGKGFQGKFFQGNL